MKATLLDLVHRFKSQHWAFILLCVYLMFEYNRPQTVWPAIDVLPWAQSLLILSAVLSLGDRSSRSPPAVGIAIMSAFAVSVVASTLTAFDPATAYSEWPAYFGWFVVVLLITRVVSTRERLVLFFIVYYLVNLKMAQHGFRMWAGRGFGFSTYGATGSPGWFRNSGEFGMQMAMVLPLIVAHLHVVRSHVSRGVFMLGVAFATMVAGSIIASSSRGALLALIPLAVWLLVISKKRLRAALVVLIGLAALWLVTPDEFKDRFRSAGQDDTSVARLVYWEYGLRTIREHPALGIGFKNWPEYVKAHYPELLTPDGRAEVIHNSYLEAGTELGYFGLLLLAVTLTAVLWINVRTANHARSRGDDLVRASAHGLIASLLVFIVSSSFMSVLFYPFLWILLAMTLALQRVCVGSPKGELPLDSQGPKGTKKRYLRAYQTRSRA